jgi:hypothetical protein
MTQVTRGESKSSKRIGSGRVGGFSSQPATFDLAVTEKSSKETTPFSTANYPFHYRSTRQVLSRAAAAV